jgi:hypothetical protein
MTRDMEEGGGGGVLKVGRVNDPKGTAARDYFADSIWSWMVI